MAAFTGTLRSNEIFAALFNMIISQDVFADNIAGIPSLVDKARVDGSLYGDTKLYYATDALKSVAWPDGVTSATAKPWATAMQTTATNLLAINRAPDPKCQAISIDNFRQISLTVDEYLSKRAWSTEGAFSAFNSVMLGWVNDTKRIYDTTTYNAYFGTAVSKASRATISVPLAAITATGEEKARLEAQIIAQTVANLMTDMTDVSRDFNDYKFLRSYSEGDIKIVWNSAWLNKITKLDLPTIFHKDGVMDKFADKLPARYFGTVNTVATKGDGTKVRSLVEQDIGSNHYFAGDLILATDTAPAGTSYTQSDTVICKVVVKLPPYMSAFEVGTSFFNPKSLTENHYLTFGRNTLAYLEAYPLITLVAA